MGQTRIAVSTVIGASRRAVWSAIEDIATHPAWMEDAVAIRFTSRRHRGVGTTFDCDTRVGPVGLTDQMEVTEWRPRRAMGIRHVGIVTGTGRFTLRSTLRGRTRFTWDEQLTFPWWMGGRIGGLIAGRVLRSMWRRNLSNLKAILEGRAGQFGPAPDADGSEG